MISFGAYPLVNLAEARKKRDEARKQVLDGINPSEHHKAQKLNLMSDSENTFEMTACEWHTMKSVRWSAGYASDIMEAFRNDIFSYVRKRSIAEIKPLELLNVMRKMEKCGALEKMEKVRQRCSKVFRYAIAPDLTSVLTMHKSQHYSFLNADKIPAFIQEVESYIGGVMMQITAKRLMLTGVRTIELRAVEWSEFDLEHAIWKIPAERMKKWRSHLVPLSIQALSLLSQLQIISGNYKYVFSGRNDPNKPMSEGSINRMAKHIGYEGWLTGYGFRHTMSTLFNNCEI